MSAENHDPKLEWTGERYVPELSGNIRLEHLHRYLLAREICAGRRVLDIACGEGYGSDLLAQVATLVVGVDIALDVVRHAQTRYGRGGVMFAAGTCAAIPLADRSVDVVVSFETIEHHSDHDAMMREVKRILTPGGLLIVSSPDRHQYSEVPGYSNPYHTRELDRQEFVDLLSQHFTDVRLTGQRVEAGSVVGPLDGTQDTTFKTFDAADSNVRTDGVKAPLYLIAIATDGAMPQIPMGLLDGGDFVWASEHAEQTRAIQEQAEQSAAARETTAAALRAEIDRLEALVATLSTNKSESDQRMASYREEVERLGEHITTLEREQQERQRISDEARKALDETRRKLAAAEAELDKRTFEINKYRGSLPLLEAERQNLASRVRAVAGDLEGQRATAESLRSERERLKEWTQALLSDLDAARSESAQLTHALAGVDAQRAEVERQLTIVTGSSSWRLTSPLRASRRLASRAPGLTRKVISNATRAIYRALPLSQSAKARVKGALFRSSPWLVRHTAAYRDWREHEQRVEGAAASVATGPETTPRPPLRRFDETPIEYVPLATTPDVETRIKTLAFYLPQFHPIPQNDEWWGKGFTEWYNVARGRPQFAGHYQPHHPGELGFYDLRVLDVQRRQIELAKMYGIHGFCYHHYWFGGTRLLRRPLEQVLTNRDLDFPFCVCWANENWTRRWDGAEHEVLIAQQHSPEDDVAFLRDLEPALRDERYIYVHGRPLLIVYRPNLLPDPRGTVARWREYCQSVGLPELYLVSAQGFDRTEPQAFDFDAAIEFAPNNMGAPRINSDVARVNPDFDGTIYDYKYLVEYSREYASPPNYRLFRCVAPMWDNEARRPGRGAVFAGSTPALYSEWLENACRHTVKEYGDTPLVFVNAWNEWAEGAHLEPDRDYGYAYLQATADTLRKFPEERTRQSIVLVTHDAHFYGAQRLALILAQTLSGPLNYEVDTIICGGGPLVARFADAGRVHEFFDPTSTPEAQEQVIRHLYVRGARVALCNTSCVGDVVEKLKAAGFQVVSMIHELPGLIGEYGLEPSIAKITRHADKIVFPAGVVRDRFCEIAPVPAEKAIVRPQGLLATNRFGGRDEGARRELRAMFGLDQDTKIILAVGSSHLRKGPDLFVDAGLTMLRSRDDLAFIWVGHTNGDGFEIAKQRVANAGAQDKFFFPGVLEDIDPIFSGSDIYLMTSREDPFPSVVLHAFDAELPVVAFDGAGGFVELVRRDCGVLVPYLDTDAMARAALRLLSDPNDVARLTSAGKSILNREFGFLDYVRDLVHFAQGPRVSVIVPNYNYERYLPARIRSIAMQRYRPHEIIFLDDCSSDRSVEIAEKLLATSGIPYRIFRNEHNQGVSRQWVRGLREATGDLVWIAETDDECTPEFLEVLVPTFADPGVILAYCQSKQIDGTGQEIASDYLQWTDDVDPKKWRAPYVRRGADEIRDTLAIKNTIPNVSAVVMRPPDLSAIEAELLNLRNAHDWLLYVQLLEHGDLAYVPTVLNAHRRHSGSVTLGGGAVNLMREILLVQRYIVDRHAVSTDVERKREASVQAAYEYLGLHEGGPASYKDHPALNSLTELAR